MLSSYSTSLFKVDVARNIVKFKTQRLKINNIYGVNYLHLGFASCFGIISVILLVDKEGLLLERIYNPITAMFTFQLENNKR